MSFPLTITGPYDGWLTPTSTQKMPLGSRMVFPDSGRVFHYALAGALDLAIGRVMQEAVVTSGHTKDLVPAAAAIGAATVTLTNSTTAVTKDMYAEGYLFINAGAGAGQIATIKTHPAEATGIGNFCVTLEDEDALKVALVAATSKVGLRKNLYKDVVVAAIAKTAPPIGVTPCAVTAAYYCWLQTWGPCAVLTNGTVIVSLNLAPSGTTAGSVDVYPLNSVAASGQEPVIGWVMSVGATAEHSLVFLTIAP